MSIYIIIATFLFVGIFVPNKFHKIYYKLSIGILFLFTAFRDINLGGFDTENYQRIFYYQVPQLSNILNFNYEYEYGYSIFNSLIKTLSMDYRVYQVIYTFIAVFLLCFIIKRLKLNKNEQYLFLFVFFCYQFIWNNFVLLRQNVATLIVWWALISLFHRPFRSYIGIIFSWLWHKSSLINILVFPIVNLMRRINRKKLLIITIIVSVFFLLFSEIVFRNFLEIVYYFAGSKYERYALDNSRGVNIINYALKWFFVMIFYFNYKKISNPHKELLLITSFLALMLSSINIEIVDRFVEYYMISIYAIIPISLQAFSGKAKYLYVISLYFAFITILVRFLLTFSGGELLKYSTFF